MKGMALLDWLTFSVKGLESPDIAISQYLKMDTALFEDKCFGNYGYLRSKSFNGIMVYYSPADDRVGDMGVCVSMSGAGCRTFEAHTPTIKLRLKARQPAASFPISKPKLLEWERKWSDIAHLGPTRP